MSACTYKSPGVLVHEYGGLLHHLRQRVEDIVGHEVVREALAQVERFVLQRQLDELNPDILLQASVFVSQVKFTHFVAFLDFCMEIKRVNSSNCSERLCGLNA